MINIGNAVGLIQQLGEAPALVATDPPYAFGNTCAEHAISATVAIALREAAQRLQQGRWMVVMCAASWRSTAYVEAVRGIAEPIRIATWCKPTAKCKVAVAGWQWASVNVIAFRKGKSTEKEPTALLDHILAEPV